MALDLILDAATKLHTCLCAQVNLLPIDDRPQRCSLIPATEFELGVSLTEDMCRCGTAWVRIDSYVPSDQFPAQQQVPTNCGPPQWALTLELGIARCPPIGDANVLPTDAEWIAYTDLVMADAQAMRQAVICCFGPTFPNRRYLIGSWAPFGPEGLCGGGRMTVQVQVMKCDEC